MRTLIFLSCLLFCLAGQAKTIYLTRHYEKTSEPAPSLARKGQSRAQALAAYFNDKPLQQIYSTSYKRTLETCAPVSASTGLDIMAYPADDLAAFADKLHNTSSTVLVVGHSNTTPRLIELLGGPSTTINEDDYGTLYKLTLNESGTTMSESTILPDADL